MIAPWMMNILGFGWDSFSLCNSGNSRGKSHSKAGIRGYSPGREMQKSQIPFLTSLGEAGKDFCLILGEVL